MFVSYWQMADVAEKSGPAEAREWWRKGHDQLAGMKQRGIMLPTDEPYLDQLRQNGGAP